MNRNIFILWILLFSHSAFTQTGIDESLTAGQTGSIYSSFGLGEILNEGFGLTEALGGTGIGLRPGFFVNTLNPAALTSIVPPLNTIFDLGINIEYQELRDENKSTNQYDGNLTHFNTWFRIGKHWGTSISFSPYSDFSYNIVSERYSETVGGKYNVLYGGNGGLNQIAWGNGVSLGDRLSIGGRSRILFGALNRTEDFISNGTIPSFTVEESIFIQGLAFDFGAQYQVPLKDNMLTVGATFAPATGLGSTSEELLQQGASIIEGEASELEAYRLPLEVGLGFSWQSKRLLLAADLTFEQWSESNINSSIPLTDKWRFSIGGEWIPNYSKYKTYNQMVLLRYGFNLSNSEYNFDGTNFRQWGMNVGAAFPFNRFSNHVQMTYKYQHQGTLDNDLINETTHTLSLSFSLRDIWFIKPKIR